MKARKKPLIVDVVKFDAKNPKLVREAEKFAGDSFKSYQEHYASDVRVFYIETLEGEMKISNGDYIIKGVNGEFYPCKPDIFEKTYNIIPEDGGSPIKMEMRADEIVFGNCIGTKTYI